MKKSLCGSCAHLINARIGNRTINRCGALDIELKDYADYCRAYYPSDRASLRDMYSIAWQLESKRIPGFERTQNQFIAPKETNQNLEFETPSIPGQV